MEKIRVVSIEDYALEATSSFEKEVVKSLETPYCSKIEEYEESIAIRLRAESKDSEIDPMLVMGIVLQNREITVIKVKGDFAFLQRVFNYQYHSFPDLFSSIVLFLIKDDGEYLSSLEKEGEAIEEKMLSFDNTNYFPLLSKKKRTINQLQSFYMDNLSILDTFESSLLYKNTRLEQKLTRLSQYAERVNIRIIDIRNEGESLAQERENRTMVILTVVTTIFLPLCLLTGLY